MITAKLQGGLGNQMFQIATAYALAKRYNYDYGFNFDSCHTPNQGNISSKYKDNFFKGINRLNDTKFDGTYTEASFSYEKIYKNDNTILNGYYQSDKYFNDYESEIKQLFKFPQKIRSTVYSFIMRELPESKRPITSVHVRRGDYLKNPDFHTNLSETDYYKNAMEMIGGNFIFISDDIKWCKENFKGDNIFYSPFTEELEDLYLMIMCDNQIIANSSFSWWGAYLKRKMIENSKVIAPKDWFGSKGPKDTQDLYLENWIKI